MTTLDEDSEEDTEDEEYDTSLIDPEDFETQEQMERVTKELWDKYLNGLFGGGVKNAFYKAVHQAFAAGYDAGRTLPAMLEED